MQYKTVDNVEDLNSFIRAGWEWVMFTGDGHYIQFRLQRKKPLTTKSN